jgi:hypothetical protein
MNIKNISFAVVLMSFLVVFSVISMENKLLVEPPHKNRMFDIYYPKSDEYLFQPLKKIITKEDGCEKCQGANKNCCFIHNSKKNNILADCILIKEKKIEKFGFFRKGFHYLWLGCLFANNKFGKFDSGNFDLGLNIHGQKNNEIGFITDEQDSELYMKHIDYFIKTINKEKTYIIPVCFEGIHYYTLVFRHNKYNKYGPEILIFTGYTGFDKELKKVDSFCLFCNMEKNKLVMYLILKIMNLDISYFKNKEDLELFINKRVIHTMFQTKSCHKAFGESCALIAMNTQIILYWLLKNKYSKVEKWNEDFKNKLEIDFVKIMITFFNTSLLPKKLEDFTEDNILKTVDESNEGFKKILKEFKDYYNMQFEEKTDLILLKALLKSKKNDKEYAYSLTSFEEDTVKKVLELALSHDSDLLDKYLYNSFMEVNYPILKKIQLKKF